ncbi:hypothetical protein Esti_004345 [Eimeria stiedai]
MNSSFYGHNERQNAFGRCDPQPASAELMYSSDQPAFQDWPCSQPQLRLPGGLQDGRGPPSQEGFRAQQSQSQAMLHQPATQFTSGQANVPGGSQHSLFPGCISSTHKRSRAEQRGIPEQMKDLNFGQLANQASCAAPSKIAHRDASVEAAMHSRQDSQAMSMPAAHLPAAHRIQQTFSQACSTQAETVTSTQRAAACEPPKMQMDKQAANIKRLQSYMRLDGNVKHDNIRYYKYVDERPGIKPNYWLRCAYCTSNKIYRRVETLRKHMASNACSWVSGSQVPIQPLPENTQGSELQHHKQKPPLPPGSSSAKARRVTFPTDSASRQVFNERQHTGQQAAAEVQAAAQRPRQLVSLCGGSVSEVNVVTSQLLSRHESGTNPFGFQRESNREPAGFASSKRLTASSSLSSRPLEVMPVSMAARDHQGSPLSSAVSTCLEELPLEQLLGRLSDKDIKLLLQSTIHKSLSSLPAPGQREEACAALHQEAAGATSAKSTQKCMQSSTTTERVAVQTPQEEPLRCVEEGSVSVQQSDQQPPSSASAAAGAPSVEGQALRNASPPAVFRSSVKPQASAKKVRVPKPRPTNRSCAVQTKLRMSYIEKALLFYADRNNRKKPNFTQKVEMAEDAANTRSRSDSQKRAKKLGNAPVLRISPKPAELLKRSCPRLARRVAEKRETKSQQVKVENPTKQSQRLSCIHQDKQEESEVLRQQSCEFPLLLVGAALMIKENQKASWQPCIVGKYHSSTGRHEPTLAMWFTARKSSSVAAADRIPIFHNARMLIASASATKHVKSSSIGSRAANESEHRRNLEKRLQAQLKDGSRSKDVKRLGDPLVKHLLRVAGNTSYRETRQSIIVTGKTLICELLSRFPCKRLAARRQGLAALQSFFGKRNPSSSACRMEGSMLADRTSNHHDQHFQKSSRVETASLTLDVETHCVSNRILRKVAGFHSYDDGCIAEMRMPEPSTDMGNIRLLLCVGRLPPAFGLPMTTSTSGAASFASGSVDSGAVGTLLRTAAALQWQGAWILPSCPDVFNPLAIRASQGALFWLPFRRGRQDELVQFCREKNLAICAPHPEGIPVTAAGIFEDQKKSVLWASQISAMQV